MSSIKIMLLKHKKKKDGTHPLALRIIKDRKAKYIFFGQWIRERDWNEAEGKVRKTHPNSVRLNNLILKKEAEASDLILENDSKKNEYSARTILDEIRGVGKGKSFFNVADEWVQEHFDQKRYTSGQPEKSKVNVLRRFFGADARFADINAVSINKYVSRLLSEGRSKKTVMGYLITIRTVYNRAIREGHVERAGYPFGGDKIKIRRVDGTKIGLDKEELQEIIKLKYVNGSPKWHTRNVFLISFYFAGARIADVLRLKWNDIQRGRLYYTMGKNDKPVSIKIPEQAKEILDQYKHLKQNDKDYVFPDLKNADPKDKLATLIRIRTATKRFNDDLKEMAKEAGITKKVSNHIARHTFGNIAGNRIPIPMLQKLYRHSSMLTTAIYQGNFMHKDTDDALDAVVNL